MIPSEIRRRLRRKVSRLFFGVDVRIKFYRKLASLLRNGVRLQTAVENARARLMKSGKSAMLVSILTEIVLSLKAGKSLAVALQPYVPPNEIMLIKSGEKSGDLPDTLMLAAEMIGATRTMKTAVRKAVTQPLVVTVMVFVAIWVVGVVVVPQLARSFDPEQWRGVARSLYTVSQFIQTPAAMVVPVVMIAMLAAVVWSLPRWTGRFRVYADRLPPYSFYRLLNGGGWMLSLSALIQSGVIMREALQMMRETSSPWMDERLRMTSYLLRSGKSLGVALSETGLEFPDRDLIDDLVVYSEFPDFDAVLYKIAKEWMSEGLEAVQVQASALNQITMIILGIVVAWFSYGTVEIQTQIGSHFSSFG